MAGLKFFEWLNNLSIKFKVIRKTSLTHHDYFANSICQDSAQCCLHEEKFSRITDHVMLQTMKMAFAVLNMLSSV